MTNVSCFILPPARPSHTTCCQSGTYFVVARTTRDLLPCLLSLSRGRCATIAVDMVTTAGRNDRGQKFPRVCAGVRVTPRLHLRGALVS